MLKINELYEIICNWVKLLQAGKEANAWVEVVKVNTTTSNKNTNRFKELTVMYI